MKYLKLFFSFFAASLLLLSCGSKDAESPMNPEISGGQDVPVYGAEDFTLCKGADVSWLTQMEDQGIKFYYPDGTEGDCMEILKSIGMNAMRFRVWVKPANKYSSTSDMVAKAKRAAALGLDVMVDFHYSDSWADPGQQTVPASWEGQSTEEMCSTLATYTTTVLTKLKEAGVSPKWVQIGNETGNGMLWPNGQASTNPEGYVALNNAGYDAVKGVFPDAKVIVHVQNGQDAGLFKWLFDLMEANGAKYDVIGMSLYPEPNNYTQYVADCKANMEACIAAYGKEVMLCEVGMGESYVSQCRAFLEQCFALSEQIPDDKFLGVLYWEPQCYNNWQGYTKGAFTNEGRPSGALDAYKYLNTSMKEVTAD